MGKPLGLLAKEVLVAVGQLAVAYIESPMGSRHNFSRWVYGHYQWNGKPYDRRFYQTLRRLEQRGYIRRSGTALELSAEAHRIVQRVPIERLTLKHPAWDGQWRVLIWDIPEENRRLRNRVRRILKKLGVVQIQQSVWVTPHPCRDELQLIRDEVGIKSGLLYLEASRIEGQQKLEEHFALRNE